MDLDSGLAARLMAADIRARVCLLRARLLALPVPPAETAAAVRAIELLEREVAVLDGTRAPEPDVIALHRSGQLPLRPALELVRDRHE